MKKTRAAQIFSFILALTLVFANFPIKSYADPFTASQIASTAYVLMQNWGISFTANTATAAGMNNFMAEQVENYVNSQGGSIADVFVGQIAVDAAGKLVVAQEMYNSIIGFANYFINQNGLDNNYKVLNIDGVNNGDPSKPGLYYVLGSDGSIYIMSIYESGTEKTRSTTRFPTDQYDPGGVDRTITNNLGSYIVVWKQAFIAQWGTFYQSVSSPISTTTNALSSALSQDYTEPTVLNPNQEWTGNIDGYSTPDTNLEDLLGGIDQAIADNNLDVEAEVVPIDPPAPSPTPIPIDPGTPLSDVPWEGVDNNMQELINQGREETGLIGEVGNSIVDAIGNAVNSIINAIQNAINSVITWLQSIYNKIVEGFGNLLQTLQNIYNAVKDIVESIVNADSEWFSNIVQSIWTPFLPILNIFKTGVGIWHYVIEWLQAIHAPFVTFWNFLGSAGYVFLTPIYATAAAAIVIAIYRRFGR